MNNEINIVMAINEKYIMPARVTIASLKENKKDEIVNIYIFHFNISNKGVALLESDSIETVNIKCIQINENDIPDFDVYFEFSKEIMIKLFVHKFLSKSVDKVLWLDCDMLILKPLIELFEYDLDNNYFLAYKDQKVKKKYLDYIKFNGSKSYLNVGTLLINLNSIRNDILYEKRIIDKLETSDVRLEFTEQDLVNLLYIDKSIVINDSFEFNSFVDTIRKKDIDNEEVGIIHYEGYHLKPWKGCATRHYHLWWKYAMTIKEYRKEYWKILPIYIKNMILKVFSKIMILLGIKKLKQ